MGLIKYKRMIVIDRTTGRELNSKEKKNRVSLKNIDFKKFNAAYNELTKRIKALDLDDKIKKQYLSKLSDVDNDKNATKNLKKIVSGINNDLDKLDKGACVFEESNESGTEFKILTQDEISKELKSIEKYNKKVDELKRKKKENPDDFKSQETIDAELKDAQDKLDKAKNFGDKCVQIVSKDAPDLAKGLLTGSDEERAKALVDTVSAAIHLLTGGAKGIFYKCKGSYDERKAGKQISKEKIDELEKISTNYDKVKKEMDKDPELAKPSKPEAPKNESKGKDKSKDKDADKGFEGVGKIKDWPSAFKYGYAKLKQMHGDNYDESKAKACLEGLKKKYPNNPAVVIGALKYGGKHKDEDEKSENNSRIFIRTINGKTTKIIDKSRINNTKPRLPKVTEEFDDPQPAYDWLMTMPDPTKEPYAIITCCGRVGGMAWYVEPNNEDSEDTLALYCDKFEGHKKLINLHDWEGKRGEMFDYIARLIKDYGDDAD